MKQLKKEEIQQWIELLYKDLLQDQIYIGGYYFSFKQLPRLEKTYNNIKELLEQDNYNDLNAQICEKQDKSIQLSQSDKNSYCGGAQRAQKRNLDKLPNLIIQLETKNRFNELKTFPCTQDEFCFVFNSLEDAKFDVEHFRTFLLEELDTTPIDQYNDFMVFINDLLDDTRLKFQGKQKSILLD